MEPTAPNPKRRWFSVRNLVVMTLLIILTLAIAWVATGQGAIFAFRKSVATADRIVVRDGGFDCCGPVDDDVILFEVTEPSEIKAVLMNVKFTGCSSPCNCCGFPGIDWYVGKKRLALTAVQHGNAIRWKGCPADINLTEGSKQWLVEWMVRHGVQKTDIEHGCGGPRKHLRQHAAQMKLAQTCVTQGEAHAAKGDLDAAIADFTEAINHDVNFARAYYLRGIAHEKKGNLDRAIQDFREAIWFTEPFIIKSRAEAAKFISDSDAPTELDGNLAPVYYARGRAYEKKGEKAKADDDFAQAKKLEDKPK
jgi:tetratricopeptide (TPR) repeat protein